MNRRCLRKLALLFPLAVGAFLLVLVASVLLVFIAPPLLTYTFVVGSVAKIWEDECQISSPS